MRLEDLKIRVYARLPRPLKVRAVRWTTANFTIGTVALLTRTGDDLLMVRPAYRRGWVPPGGLLQRGETPEQCLVRELAEELGVEVRLGAAHRVAFEPRLQMVTYMYAGKLAPGAEARRSSPELVAVEWFPLDGLPTFSPDFHEGLLPEDLAAIRRVCRA